MMRTRHTALALLLGAAACGPAEVAVTMELDVPDAEGTGTVVRPLPDVEVELLPFDRDQIFDSLEAAYPEPAPEIPPELQAAREEVQAAQAEYEQAQRRWSLIRDTLSTISETMEQYSRGEPQYLVLFREFSDWEGQLSGAETTMNRAFERFDSLQQGTIRASDSVRILQENWAAEAFADAAEIFQQKRIDSGLDLAVDTTDANGMATLRVRPGQYWVHARYELPYSELYWNEPIQVERGEPVPVLLNRENAEERPRL
ncbi:MAG TPA: hypothetical protein VFQ22_00360 [Longimicrobiales bacterium]|nr:hypothetical protein [Longimicrobiales bacterium]